jgi:ATP-binding cassette subfamily C protein
VNRHGPIFKSNDAWQLFLLSLRYREGDLLTLNGSEPFLLKSGSAWIVYNGSVDLFSVRLENGVPTGRRQHFNRLHTDQLMVGVDSEASGVGLLAVCAPETQLLRLRTARLETFGAQVEYADLVATLVEDWTRTLSRGIAPDVPPKDVQRLEANSRTPVDAEVAVSSARGLVWVRDISESCQFLGGSGLPNVASNHFFPLTDTIWLRTTNATQLEALATETFLTYADAWEDLAQYARFVMDVVATNRASTTTSQQKLVETRETSDTQRVLGAIEGLSESWGAPSAIRLPITRPGLNPWLASSQLVGAQLGIEMKAPPDGDTLPNAHPLDAIARASVVRTRRVILRGNWWKADNGPLLGTYFESGIPVALLQPAPGKYTLHDPATGTSQPVNAQLAEQLSPEAFMLYQPLPNHALSAMDLLRFGLRPVRRDLGWLIFAGVLGGLLGTLTPVMTGLIFDQILPSGSLSQLGLSGVILLLIVASITLFQLLRSQALLRLDLWMGNSVQSAVWDRVLKLPTHFFRRYAPGELAERAMGITLIRQILSDAVVLALLSGLFSIFNFLILFFVDAQLGLLVTVMAGILIAATFIVGGRMVKYERATAEIQGEISGLVTQLFSGISKLHVAGAERRAFALWAESFSAQKRQTFHARSVQVVYLVLLGAFPVLVSIVVFASIARRTDLSTGTFLAFNAALVLFLTATLQLCAALIAAVRVVPIYERMKPLLQTEPEVDTQKASPGELNGSIEVSHVTFRYNADGPVVLDDVSFSVRPGEFVAIVGPSGSGKSSLLRLLLGFETPEAGAIYYNGLSLTDLDVRSVRRQMGVVLQHSQVFTGSILQNIIGSDNLPLDRAWEAARLAGIEDDIKALPMGMQTFISEGGATFSGGQRQRLLIARALVGKPRLFFFDEATSALDDVSQALVTRSLKELQATRIVIAHRLSTIADADRIIVFERGRIVESGSYTELMVKEGLFAKMARRQML